MNQVKSESGNRSEDYLKELISKHQAIDLTSIQPVSIDCDPRIYEKENATTLSAYINRKYFRAVNPETEISFAFGVNQAIFIAVASTVKEGDSVILFEPYAYDLKRAVEICGARPVYIPLKEPAFKIDWCEVQRAINANTRLIVIPSPHPLTGQPLTSEDFEELQRLINGTKIKLVIDEASAELAYSGYEGSSVNFYPKLCQVTYRIGSLNRWAGLNGSEIAYCIAPENLMSMYKAIHSAISCTPSSEHLERYTKMLVQEPEPTAYAQFLEENYHLVEQHLKETKFLLTSQNAGHIVLLGYKNVSELKDTEFAEKLVAEMGLGLQPLSRFYHDKQCRRYVAMNISVPRSTLVEALNRLASLK